MVVAFEGTRMTLHLGIDVASREAHRASPMILGRLGDANRFRDLAAIRSYSGLVPGVDQSGVTDRKQHPTKAAKSIPRSSPASTGSALPTSTTSALCTLGAVLLTRIAACWRRGEHYQLKDLDGRVITPEEGRRICSELKPIPIKTDRRRKESRSAPNAGPSTAKTKTPPRLQSA